MKETLSLTWDGFVEKQQELRRQDLIRKEEEWIEHQDEGISDEDDQMDISDG